MHDASSPPDLYVFAISHYCEKARWALDLLGIDYQIRYLTPGTHVQRTQQLGAAGSALPLLVSSAEVVQGSGAILDWADRAAPDAPVRLRPDPGLEDEARALEQRLDDVVGVHARRYYYSEALVEHPDGALAMLSQGASDADRQALEVGWAVVRPAMMASLGAGPEQWHESRRVVEGELDWLDGLLADGRRFLLGDRLSRVDVTAASLLSPVALPKEHPTYGALQVPPRASADVARWAERPSLAWVRALYRDYR